MEKINKLEQDVKLLSSTGILYVCGYNVAVNGLGYMYVQYVAPLLYLRVSVELFITYCIPHLLLVCELRAAAEESTSLFREAIAALDIKSKGI